MGASYRVRLEKDIRVSKHPDQQDTSHVLLVKVVNLPFAPGCGTILCLEPGDTIGNDEVVLDRVIYNVALSEFHASVANKGTLWDIDTLKFLINRGWSVDPNPHDFDTADEADYDEGDPDHGIVQIGEKYHNLTSMEIWCLEYQKIPFTLVKAYYDSNPEVK